MIKQLAALTGGLWLFLVLQSSSAAAQESNRGHTVKAANRSVADNPISPRSTFGVRQPFKINQANRRRYSPHIDRIARQHRLDPALVHAVISVESGYNPKAVSPKGAMGLMQLMPTTAALYGVDDPFDPIANIKGGVRYLRFLLNKFKRINLALAAYNAGTDVVVSNRNTIPPYMETRKYVNQVINFYMYYKLSQ